MPRLSLLCASGHHPVQRRFIKALHLWLAFPQQRHTECRCECKLDGMAGNACELPVEQTCINQCSGRGACYLGFCKCFDGWYGHACHRQSGASSAAGSAR